MDYLFRSGQRVFQLLDTSRSGSEFNQLGEMGSDSSFITNVLNPTLNVTNSISLDPGLINSTCSYLCLDKEGWFPASAVISDITPCFLDGVVLTLPSLLIIFFGSFQIKNLLEKRAVPCRTDWHFWTKLSLVALQIVFTIATAIINAADSSAFLHDVHFLGPSLNTVALGVAFALHYIEHFRSRIPTGSLLFFWLSSIIALFVNFLVLTRNHYHEYSLGGYLLASSRFLNACIIFFLEYVISKSRSDYENLVDEDDSPMDQADVFSRIFFLWMTDLMKKGYDSYLTEEDLPSLPKENETHRSAEKLDKNWTAQLANKGKEPSLFWAIAKSFGGPFLVGGFYKIVHDILAFVNPQLLRLLIKFVNEYTFRVPEESIPISNGFMIAIGMFVVSLLQTAVLHQYFQRAFDTGMRVRAGLTSAVYHKALKLSNEGRSSCTGEGKMSGTGDIINLMSVDTQRLSDISSNLFTIVSGPFQLILCLVSLHELLGNSMWAGVFIMVVMIPFNSYIAKYQKTLQKVQMGNKDQRTRLTSEMLTNVKSLKLYGWEAPFMDRLNHVRNDKELTTLKKIGVFSAVTNFLWSCAPFLVSCSTFGIFVLTQDTPLTTDIVFPALTLFNLLGFPLAVIPMVITGVIEASVSTGRLRTFFLADELQTDAIVREEKAVRIGDESVKVEHATFLWERSNAFKTALTGINFVANKGDLSCIVGKVGSGKSSFLKAILGDLYRAEGKVTVRGKVAYVSQVPWIMNDTVKENILFGARFDASFYEKTIHACALIDDLAILPDGDETQVGEKGISLSGGQKARLSLARAVYARADIYLLDDPLSAVDEHVGHHIIENVLGQNGLLKTKCKILATNSITVLSHADQLTMISEGKIVESGTYDYVMESKSALYNLIKEFGKARAQRSPDATATDTATDISSASSAIIDTLDESENEPKDIFDMETVTRQLTTQTLRRASIASFKKSSLVQHDDETRKTRQSKEFSEKGKVKWDVYKEYAKACNLWTVMLFLIMLLTSTATSVAGNVWLKHWAEVNSREGGNPHVLMYLGVYFALGVGSSFLTVCQTLILWIFCAIHSAKELHNRMLNSVMRAPMSFFETTPLGRILNRFSNDMFKVDEVLARVFSQFFSNSVKVMFTIMVISSSTPAFLLVIGPLLVLYIYFQRYYLRTSRELKRVDSVTKSPIYAHFQETLGGLSTIRAYNQESRFNFINESRLDLNLKAYFPSISANRWLAVRLEFIGSFIILAAAGLSIVSLKNNAITPGLVGLAMSYALQITQSLNWIVRMTVEVETNIVSVERILEYSDLPSEAPVIVENNRPPAAWPTSGHIIFNKYSTRYRPELDLVLKGIDLDIKPREKIGIVGRTGAGKSSLTLALFRIIESSAGNIDIDNIDISKIGLSDLRHKLSIIPQDSQAFEGSIRDNLDPQGTHDDTDLWHVLELSHLKNHVQENMEGGLDAIVMEGGSNLSVGQRQLMCLARALLTPSNILVLDEATAAVDVETDKILQETIRSEFKERTILTIAHRLNTILDSDRIVVLSAGEVAEFDTPTNLLKNKESLFYSLCNQAGFTNNDETTELNN
ncbi:multidrug resistance-associated protein 1 [Nadsonia fulvescens var. elongata DSM 6958]|uniref:Multidrug resistance-associated protein 1 n=1 Tax=Nadsonia fulvescens var. elongata DSM 6958 TaxID=857566 RepID=A0A1E3PNZ7_9ASCO|nr:multidrug resistance-associated protein 1 [Nadsonia fulvescens var. elongata DSM 6958]